MSYPYSTNDGNWGRSLHQNNDHRVWSARTVQENFRKAKAETGAFQSNFMEQDTVRGTESGTRSREYTLHYFTLSACELDLMSTEPHTQILLLLLTL
jgi:hypothetical protein